MSIESNQPIDLNRPDSPHFSVEGNDADASAWTEIEAGRYMPRRVRGSFQGRALGWVFTVPSSGSDDADCQQKCDEESTEK